MLEGSSIELNQCYVNLAGLILVKIVEKHEAEPSRIPFNGKKLLKDQVVRSAP